MDLAFDTGMFCMKPDIVMSSPVTLKVSYYPFYYISVEIVLHFVFRAGRSDIRLTYETEIDTNSLF